MSGFESADWFNPAGPAAAADEIPLTWGRPVWWDHWAAEHTACRERAVLMDMSFMSKFRVQVPFDCVLICSCA